MRIHLVTKKEKQTTPFKVMLASAPPDDDNIPDPQIRQIWRRKLPNIIMRIIHLN